MAAKFTLERKKEKQNLTYRRSRGSQSSSDVTLWVAQKRCTARLPGRLSEIIVLRIGPRDMESILCVMWRLCSLFCLLLLQTVNVKMAFYWKHKYVFTSRIGAGGTKPPSRSLFILWKLKQTNKKPPSAVISQINPSLLWGRLWTFF